MGFVFLLGILKGISLASAYDLNFLEGFRGIKWGESAEKIKNLKKVEKGDFDWYVKETDELKISNVELEAINYGFYKDKFCYLLIIIKDKANYEVFKKLLFEKFGEGEAAPLGKVWDWFLGKQEGIKIEEEFKELENVFGANIWMRLEFDEEKEKGNLYIQNLETMMQKVEDEGKRIKERF